MNISMNVSGHENSRLLDDLDAMLTEKQPAVIGIASAFVSTQGVEKLAAILKRAGNPACRLVAGIDHAITHPKALSTARSLGWDVRFGKAQQGIFHPKLFVGGSSFRRDGGIKDVSCFYVGSSNLTLAGLEKNLECGILAGTDDVTTFGADIFSAIWIGAAKISESSLRAYSARFAEISRARKPEELQALGVSDGNLTIGVANLQNQRPPLAPVVATQFAAAAWTGLQSFTGEYRFQVEFPRDAGRVLVQLVGALNNQDGRVDVYCSADGEVREMQYRFYPNNGMFRLNIPNDVPNVAWARANHDGVAVVEKGPVGGAPLRLRILRPGVDADAIVERSVLMGSWGRTSTRIYGWY